MRKMMIVAVREYQAAVRTKAFIFSLIAMPVMMLVAVGLQKFLRDKVDINDKHIAILDHTGQLQQSIIDAADLYNEHEIYTQTDQTTTQVKPKFIIHDAVVHDENPDQITLKLSDRVRNKELYAFVIIGKNVINPDNNKNADYNPLDSMVQYHSNTPTNDNFPRWLTGPLNAKIQGVRLEAVQVDPVIVAKATLRVPVSNLGLVSVDEFGQITQAKESNRVANFLLPFGIMMLMYMVVMMGAGPLMQSVLEEKMQRIAEVLLGSIPPFQLMMGKLIGTVGISLTMATVYMVGGYLALDNTGFGSMFPTHILLWFMLFLILAVFMYGSIFIAIGAAVSDMKESQSLMTPVMLMAMSPMFVWMNIIREPTSTLATIMSLFPPVTPMLMTIRLTVPPGIPIWQPILGTVLVTATSIVLVFASGRIFRVGILMQGRGAKISEMVRWLFTSERAAANQSKSE